MFFVCKPGREAISTSESAACSARQGQLDWPRAQERRIARYAPQSGRHRHRACAVFEGVLGRRVVLCHVTPTRVQRQSTCAPRALKSMVVFLAKLYGTPRISPRRVSPSACDCSVVLQASRVGSSFESAATVRTGTHARRTLCVLEFIDWDRGYTSNYLREEKARWPTQRRRCMWVRAATRIIFYHQLPHEKGFAPKRDPLHVSSGRVVVWGSG